jgi:hypothetical protein
MGKPFEFDALSVPNLSAFKARAVVDWLDVAFTTAKPTNFSTVQDKLQLILGSENPPYVKALDEGPGRAATHFWARLHDPETATYVQDVLARLGAHISISGAPFVHGIEVAVDFYHRGSDRAQLEALTLRLKRAIHPEDGAVWIESNAYGSGRVENIGYLRADTTLRITGENIGWRVYLKETDNNKEPIADATLHRVRAEVTLSGPRIPDGYRELNADARCKFERLARHFRFRSLAPGLSIPEKPATVGEHILKHQLKQACGRGHIALDAAFRGCRRFSRFTVADGKPKERFRLALRDLTRRYFAEKPEKS